MPTSKAACWHLQAPWCWLQQCCTVSCRGVVKVGGWFELLFVNSFGMPFNSGLIVYIILLAASIIWGVYESYTEKSRKRMNISFMVTIAMLGIPFYGYGWSSALIGIIILGILGVYLFADLNKKYQISARTLNTSLLCIMMIMVGYSSYALIVIRSTANTPMDQNSPEDIFTLGEYLGREQYGNPSFVLRTDIRLQTGTERSGRRMCI